MGLACSASSKNRQAHPVKLSEEDERKAKQIQANLIKAMEDFLKILKDVICNLISE